MGGVPTTLALGDFNEDRLVDLVVTNRDAGEVAMLLSDGAGGFEAPAQFAVGAEPTVPAATACPLPWSPRPR